jgi:hypothetical protein
MTTERTNSALIDRRPAHGQVRRLAETIDVLNQTLHLAGSVMLGADDIGTRPRAAKTRFMVDLYEGPDRY